MKTIVKMMLLLACVSVIAGCGGEAKKEAAKPVEVKKEAAPAVTEAPKEEEAAASSGHTDGKNLGKQTVGAYTLEVVAYGGIVAGDEEADVDVDIDGGTPKAVRAWAGLEDGVGSVKAMAEEEEPGHYHVHVPVPATLAEGAKLWVELEGEDGTTQLASFAI